MISKEEYQKYRYSIKLSLHALCWICKHSFTPDNDPYFYICQCKGLKDMHYKEFYICKSCWLNTAGEDWVIEDDERLAK